MAVLTPSEDFKGRRARRNEQRSEYTREFIVQTTAWLTDGALAVRLATGIPRVGDVHPDDLGARVRDVTAEPEQDDANLWRVRCTYATNVLPLTSEDPLDRPKELSWTFQPITELAERAYDASGNLTLPIHNSAQMPYVPALEVESHIPTLQITRNELAFNVGLVTAYMDTLNNATWYTAPAGTVKFSGASANNVTEGDTTYWRVTYNFQFKRKGWDTVVADSGLYEIIGSTTGGKPMYGAIKQLDPNGEKLAYNVTEPVYLKAGLVKPLADAIDYLTFKLYKRADFSALNLE